MAFNAKKEKKNVVVFQKLRAWKKNRPRELEGFGEDCIASLFGQHQDGTVKVQKT